MPLKTLKASKTICNDVEIIILRKLCKNLKKKKNQGKVSAKLMRIRISNVSSLLCNHLFLRQMNSTLNVTEEMERRTITTTVQKHTKETITLTNDEKADRLTD